MSQEPKDQEATQPEEDTADVEGHGLERLTRPLDANSPVGPGDDPRDGAQDGDVKGGPEGWNGYRY